MKQIPFRYDEDLEKALENLYRLQRYTKKKNKALIDAVKIASAYIQKNHKNETISYDIKDRISKDLNIEKFY